MGYMAISVIFSLRLASNIEVRVLSKYASWVAGQEVEKVGYMVVIFLLFLGIPILLSIVEVLSLVSQCMIVLYSPHPHQHL